METNSIIPFEPTQEEADKLKEYFELTNKLKALKADLIQYFVLKGQVGANKVDYNNIGKVTITEKTKYVTSILEELPKKFIVIKKELDKKMVKQVLEMGEKLPEGIDVVTEPSVTFKQLKGKE